MREEARQKGIPEEMINKLIPVRLPPGVAPVAAPQAVTLSTTSVITPVVEQKVEKLTRSDLINKLGYLTQENPVKFTTELHALKYRKKQISLWNSVDLGDRPNFNVNTFQLKSRANIDPKELKLDDVGFDYQKILVITVISATILAFGSSYIGGQVGFIFGYASALIPVTLLGVGSIAPALIGDIIDRVTFAVDSDAANRYATFQAGRFLAGYALGLPVSKFSTGGPSNYADFFQLRPTVSTDATDEKEAQQYFAKKKFAQTDIAPYSVVCLAGSVAECLEYKQAKGYSANDVNTLNELMTTVEPAMTPESAQSHIKWAALKSYDILSKYPTELKRLTEAFRRGAALEECIAIAEGTE